MTSADRQSRKDLSLVKKLLLEYRVLRLEQICALFPNKPLHVMRKLVSYLNGINQIYVESGYVALNKAEFVNGLNRKLIDCIWVMLRFIHSVQYHTCRDFPAQLYFLADGVEYEVIYAAMGDEALLGSVLSHTAAADVHYLVVVETPEQIDHLEIPDVDWFCTVSKTGKITRFIQEDEISL